MKKQTLRIIAIITSVLFLATAQISTANAADSKVNSLIKRLNSSSKLWQLNAASGTRNAQVSHQRLGLYQEPTAVIECTLSYSGTWLFVYKDTGQGYKAAASNYFYRTAAYDAETLIDPKTDYIVIVHTSMGGNQKCLNSAYKVLSYITD